MKKTWSKQVKDSVSVSIEQTDSVKNMIRQGIAVAVTALMGILMPRALVFGGAAPFGVAVACGLGGWNSLLSCLFCVVGYLLPSQVVLPLRYIAAVAIVLCLRWAFLGLKKASESVWFAPVVTCVSLLVSGIAVFGMNGLEWDIVLSVICESLLGGGFAYFYCKALTTLETTALPSSLGFADQASLVLVCSSVLMALDQISLNGISPGRILTMMMILLAAKAGQQYGGMLSGVIFSATATLCMPTQLNVVSSYAFAGMIAGSFSRMGRVLMACMFSLVHILVLFSSGDWEIVILGGYELLAACLLFLILPVSVEKAAKVLFCRAYSVPAVEGLRRSLDMRLVYTADTIREIARTVDVVSEKLAAMDAPKMKEVYSSVCEHICAGCVSRDVCWKERFTDTMNGFRLMGLRLKTNGRLTKEDMGEYLLNHCRHPLDVLNSMNTGYGHMLSKEHAYHRLADMRGVVTDQFEGMASMLTELSNEFRLMERADEQTAVRVETVCHKYKMPIVQVACLIGRRNRLSVEIITEGDTVPNGSGRWHQEICSACGCELDEPVISKSGFLTRIRLTEKPLLQVQFAFAQLNCKNETLCGDALESFYDHDGRYCVVLSDGMGSGGRAAVDGAMTAALAARMLQAGFHYDNILRIINSALIVKSKEESLATLDAIQIDLFNGYVHGLKAGAAATYLYSRGHVCKITASSLPIGILREVDAGHYEEYVRCGDVIVMVSDGVTDEDSTWIESLIEQSIQTNTDEQSLANEIVFNARERQKDRGDDTTAIVLRIA